MEFVRLFIDQPEFLVQPSGKLLHSYGKSPFLMGKSTISMAIFNSYVKLPEVPFLFCLHIFCSHFCRSNPSLFVLQHPIEIVLIVLWFSKGVAPVSSLTSPYTNI